MSLGLLEEPTRLFSYPGWKGSPALVGSTTASVSRSLDYFCDYFETPLNVHGQRYYIRQHQLRRFFAMLFFWGSSFEGLDALRWFLGHTDSEHLYNYITEATPGAVLRGIKAHYASERLQADSDASAELAALVYEHFGTREFSVLDSQELSEYVEELMIEGRVSVEPEFIRTSEGVEHRVLIKVTRLEDTCAI